MNHKKTRIPLFTGAIAVFSLTVSTCFSVEPNNLLTSKSNNTKQVCAFEIYELNSSQDLCATSSYLCYQDRSSPPKELPLQQMACFWCNDLTSAKLGSDELLPSKKPLSTDFFYAAGFYEEKNWKEEFTNQGLKHLFTLPLQELTHYSYKGISADSPKETPNQSLHFLVLYLYENITDEDVKSLTHLPLEQLNLSHAKISDLSLNYIKKLPLTSLWMNDCTNITDKGLKELKELNTLKFLSLQNCENITSKGLEALAKLPIKELSLSNNKNINDSDLECLKEFHALEFLYLENCEKITDLGLRHLKELQIKELYLSENKNITDLGLKYLLNMPLEVLELSHCKKISDKGLTYLKELSQLKSLNLENCDKITNFGLMLLKDLPLNNLDITCCKKITYSAVELFEDSSTSDISIFYDGITEN